MLAWYSDMQERMKLVEGKKCQGEKQTVQVVAQERQVERVISCRVRGKDTAAPAVPSVTVCLLQR